jgi:hypothetical protein
MRRLVLGIAVIFSLGTMFGCMSLAEDDSKAAASGKSGGTKQSEQTDGEVMVAGREPGTDSLTAVDTETYLKTDTISNADTSADHSDTATTADSAEKIDIDTDTGSAMDTTSLLQCDVPIADETEATINDAGVVDVVGDLQETSILFVFDKSGSMSSWWGGASRWRAAAAALEGAIAQAHSLLGEKLRVGALLFPMESGCEVLPLDSGSQLDFMPAESFLSTWREAAAANGPDGSTPLLEALRMADRALVKECRQGRMDHLYKVVIITDGEPNCGVEGDGAGETLTTLPSKWHEKGISTYVFGLPGSDHAEDLLNDIAAAGGSGEYYAPYQETPDGGVEERDPDDVSDDLLIVAI